MSKTKSSTVPRLLESQLDEQTNRAAKLAAKSKQSAFEAAQLVDAARKKVAASERGRERMRQARNRAQQLLRKQA